jgi:hypothetical protein
VRGVSGLVTIFLLMHGNIPFVKIVIYAHRSGLHPSKPRMNNWEGLSDPEKSVRLVFRDNLLEPVVIFLPFMKIERRGS